MHFNICNKIEIVYSGAEKKVETQVMCILFAATPERLTLCFFLRQMSYPESPGTCAGHLSPLDDSEFPGAIIKFLPAS